MCSNIRRPNNHHFPLGTNGKVVVLGVPILKHFRVSIAVVGGTVHPSTEIGSNFISSAGRVLYKMAKMSEY